MNSVEFNDAEKVVFENLKENPNFLDKVLNYFNWWKKQN